jgi:hypothetical protein
VPSNLSVPPPENVIVLVPAVVRMTAHCQRVSDVGDERDKYLGQFGPAVLGEYDTRDNAQIAVAAALESRCRKGDT